MTAIDGAAAIPGLAAGGPRPDFVRELMLFGQFVGDWAFDATWHRRDGTTRSGTGEWHFGWILEGRAVQDVWMVPSRAERERAGAPLQGYGTTVRYYDPKLDAWRVTWTGVVDGVVSSFIARRQGEEIVLEGEDPDGLPMRWIFSRITPAAFHWRRVVSEDRGASWRTELEMKVGRVA